MSTASLTAESRDWRSLARKIDHTVLKPEATRAHIEQICREARQYEFASVCVQPCWVELAASLLQGSPVKVCSVVGFPQGATLSSIKRAEAAAVVRLGAEEVDMVINVGALKSGERGRVEADIRGVAEAAHSAGAILKVIIEAALLTHEEKITACELAVKAGAEFVKTSTGFASGGATVEDVALMRATVGARARVKAAGGIRSAEDALRMIEAGADRIGASASVAIVRALGAE